MGVDSNSTLGAVECCPRCGFQYDATSSDLESFDELRDDSIHYEIPGDEVVRRLPANAPPYLPASTHNRPVPTSGSTTKAY